MKKFVHDSLSALKYGAKILNSEILGAGYSPFANFHYVDADHGSDSARNGDTPNDPVATIQQAVTNASRSDVIFVRPKAIGSGASDPTNYAETIIIPAATDGLSIIGVGTGRTQGGLPQIKKGSGSVALLTVRAPGCLIANLGFNGASATGGGILLDDDSGLAAASGGETKSAFGTTIADCHFKNCVGSTATDSRTGGAIMWASGGGAFQVLITGNEFYKNVGDVILLGTGYSVPQDVIIEGNHFLGPATSVDCHLYLAAGDGMASVLVDDNRFADVLPALGAGSVVRYVDMTGCTGMFSNNYVGGSYTTSGFGAARAAAKIPTTVGITHNYSDAGLIVRQ